jgi:phage terminase small subunit
MGALANARHERFAQELAKGKSATEAYAEAGYRPNSGNAATLKADQSISMRVAELIEEQAGIARAATEKAAERLSIDREWVLAQLVENANRAMQAVAVKSNDGSTTGEFKYEGSVANRALELIGKELGMFVDRTENVNIEHVVSDDLPTPEQWEAEHGTTH